ncbi:MAG TPA: SDR family NAD(P)-dependent oxidoreductase [Acidimicrobiia bacterium]|nr:SDR family NAD(P)-dependent oxidoreductase [Acidimicrobiia bacterium]
MGTRFAGRRVVVTGASRGIGAALAERFAAEGADVAIVARTVEKHDHLAGSLKETAARMERFGGRVAVVVADLADGDDRQRIVPEAQAALGGPIEILVNNAAAAMYAPTSTYPLRRRRITFEVNVHAPIDLAQAVLPGMVERGEGWIVNVSSGSARLLPGPPFRKEGVAVTIGIYGASKAALNRETNCLAAEMHGTGVRINTIEPRAAVMSEGATELVGDIVTDDLIEPMESMVEATLALCDCGPDLTGRIAVSTELIEELGLTVMALDGTPRAVD